MTAPLTSGPDGDPDGEFTALVDASIPRVDLVDKAANGMTFLLAKRAQGQAGLVDPALIRDLIGKSEPPKSSEQVTMTGSPAAIAKLIHQAAQRADTEPVEKETTMAADDLDATTVLAEPDIDAPGNPTMPGSPAWEAIDAATACKWTALLARARSAVGLLADREMLEAATDGEDYDADNAFDLQDACCAIDYAISLLAPYAVSEQAEADKGEEFSAFGKALAGFDPAALEVIESLGQVRKAGRVLSAANETAIRNAAESLQKVLASLPQAPTADDADTPDSGLPVAKTANEETTMATPTLTENVTAESGQEPAMGTQDPDPKPVAGQAVTVVGKADGTDGKTPMVAVYDAKGNLVGIVDPQEITPISGADTDDTDDSPDSGDGVAQPADTAKTPDLEPQPAAEAGTPADAVEDGVTKTEQATTDKTDTSNDTTSDVFKSIAETVVKAHLDAHSATQTDIVTKQSAAILELAETVETLKGQVKALEEQPAEPKVFTNGAVPSAQQMRGQDRGATPVDMAKAAELKQQLYRGATSGDQNTAAIEMQKMAIAQLQEIHHGGARQ